MKGDKQVIQYLNQALAAELTAINQYFLHARMLKDWGIDRLGQVEYDESIEEMKHADKLIERVLFLGGLPNLQDLNKLLIGENVREILECDLKAEHDGISTYRAAIKHAESVQDYGSRDLLASLLADEEAHVDFLETQLDMIDRMGLENYCQLQSTGGEEAGE